MSMYACHHLQVLAKLPHIMHCEQGNKCVKNSSPLSISGTCGVQNHLLDCSRFVLNFSTVLTFSWIQSHVLFCAWFLCRLLEIEKKFLLLLSFSRAFYLLVLFWVFAIEQILPVNMHNFALLDWTTKSQLDHVSGLSSGVCMLVVQVMSFAMILICTNQQSALCLLGLRSSVKVLQEVCTWIPYLTTVRSLSQIWQRCGFQYSHQTVRLGLLAGLLRLYTWARISLWVFHACFGINNTSMPRLLNPVCILRGSIGTWYWGRPAGEVQLVGHLVF